RAGHRGPSRALAPRRAAVPDQRAGSNGGASRTNERGEAGLIRLARLRPVQGVWTRYQRTVRAEQQHWTPAGGWTHIAGERCPRAQLVLAFGATVAMAGDVWADLRARWPEARIVGCSTAGEIAGTHVFDDSV